MALKGHTLSVLDGFARQPVSNFLHNTQTNTLAKIAYISFDVIPSHKGAAVHIESFVRSLAQAYGHIELVTVAAEPQAAITVTWPGVTHTVLPAAGKTLIDRVMHFRQHLHRWLSGRRFDIVQVRSIFEGLPVIQSGSCRSLIFEVNGLPSIELKYRYPKVAEDVELMDKLVRQEQLCLEAAEQIVTPSFVTRSHLISRGIPASRIEVIPNGVDLSIHRYQPLKTCEKQELETLNLLYFGTLSAWQGVDLAVDALALYCRDFSGQLTIVGPARGKQVAQLEKLARKLGVAESVTILEACPQAALNALMHQASAIVAPLKANDRNLVQGCCPLKVLEGMASGTPVITSDLPVVTDLGESERHFLAVRPGSSKAIKDAMLRLRADGALRKRLSGEGRSHIENHYTWQQAQTKLLTIYRHVQQRQKLSHAPYDDAWEWAHSSYAAQATCP